MAERAAGEAVRRAWSSRQDPVPTVSGAVGHGAIPGCSRDAGGGGHASESQAWDSVCTCLRKAEKSTL